MRGAVRDLTNQLMWGEYLSGVKDEAEPQMSYMSTEMILIRQDKTELN